MDANGLKFWMLDGANDWPVLSDTEYGCAGLRLRSARGTGALSRVNGLADAATVKARRDQVPQTRDLFGMTARWDAASNTVFAGGAVPGEATIYHVPAGDAVTDLAIGNDGILYMAVASGGGAYLALHDTRGRLADFILRQDGFVPWRLAAAPQAGVWVLDRQNRKLARLIGQSQPFIPPTETSAQNPQEVFHPVTDNLNPPHYRFYDDAVWPAETTVAIACSPAGTVAICTAAGDDETKLRRLDPNGRFAAPLHLAAAAHAFSLTWLSETRVALLLSDVTSESPAYDLPTPTPDNRSNADRSNSDLPLAEVPVLGHFYPLRDHTGGPFFNGLTLPPHYPSAEAALPVVPLSLATFVPTGQAVSVALDSLSGRTVWHRLYVEAVIPPHCGFTVSLTTDATIDEDGKDKKDIVWHDHHFGYVAATNRHLPDAPTAAWVREPSEIPFEAGVLNLPPQRDRVGLFTVLIQRAGRAVRSLRGQTLTARVTLYGDGRSTPQIAAVRAYASRFAYSERYLPELYREDTFGQGADAVSSATGPDFLGRFLNIIESVLTPIEDKVAAAYLLTDPRKTKEESLDWLGSWVGVEFDAGLAPSARREYLADAPYLFQARGTLPGLNLALNLVTGGGVRDGRIIVVEDFKLRRAFATILGADYADEQDPLLVGFARSGNSFVGDTLFLGDEFDKEFLALFGVDIPANPAEEAIVQAFFDELAYRVTVLVHEQTSAQDLALIRRALAAHAPAHLVARVLSATYPFMVGVASLVGVDSYPEKAGSPPPVRLNESSIGLRDLIQRPPSLDPRLEG